MHRILTTHVGSLPRPRELLEAYKAKATVEQLKPVLAAAVAEVVRKQIEIGIDVVNDGEFGKPMSDEVDYGAWAFYALDRLEGYEVRHIKVTSTFSGRDAHDFADYYSGQRTQETATGTMPVGVCVGPVRYKGQAAIGRDVGNLKSALKVANPTGVFMSALAPATFNPPGTYYKPEMEAEALAKAMREEYRAITDAGFSVQIDDPFMVNKFEFDFSMDWDLKAFRTWAERHVELVNLALQGIPEEKVRYHMCWGSWEGPHSSDLPLKEVLDLVLNIKASQYSLEGANPRHEHEWEVWKGVTLPKGKSLLPGVVTHKTMIVEHPEVVAQRIIRYADVVGPEHVIASTDCGLGGRIHPLIAWAKLKALSEGAALAGKKFWA
jgi:5-methyltetrahydropteroyltriglutamate--homocysteine methyltransferase